MRSHYFRVPWALFLVSSGLICACSSDSPGQGGLAGGGLAGGGLAGGGLAGAPSIVAGAGGSDAIAGAWVGGGAGVAAASEGGGSAGSSATVASAPSAGSAGLSSSAGATGVGAAGLAEFPPLPTAVTLHVAGDSTAAIFPATDPTGRVGWAAVAAQFFSTSVTIDDAAQSGRSSKSFIDEGFWTSLKTRIHSGDYVFIGFGHNDEKSDDPLRYTDAATTFRSYLKIYISETRALGGYAVLLTPISRRKYAAGKVTASHGLYPAAVFAVGSETGTPVIDLTDKTRIWLEALGPIDSIPFFAIDDATHLSAQGAPEVAKLVMQGIRESKLPLAERLLP